MSHPRAQPRYVTAGSSNVVLQSAELATQNPCQVLGAHLVAPAGSAHVKLYDATATESLGAGNLRAHLYAGASGSDDLTAALQFNTGLHVSCNGGGAAVTVYFMGRR